MNRCFLLVRKIGSENIEINVGTYTISFSLGQIDPFTRDFTSIFLQTGINHINTLQPHYNTYNEIAVQLILDANARVEVLVLAVLDLSSG